ncbi:MAG: Verru_Chthon cassette protein D [Rhodospirillales bacterium]|nr:Verru_Chthon cassette protein D [Acetobacter sp.]
MTPSPLCSLALARRRGGKLPGDARRAFTLVELLVVMAIIVVLMSLAMPALRGMLGGYNLTASSDNLAAQFSLARQTALGRNLPVELRIYNTGTDSAPVWNSVAMVVPAVVSGRASDEWVAKASVLSGSVIIDPGNSPQTGQPFSTLLTPSGSAAPTTASPNATAPWSSREPATAPASVKNRKYVAFRFQPDGSTNLPALDASNKRLPWSLCLRNTGVAANPAGPGPAVNYVALVLDPATGRLLTFRP